MNFEVNILDSLETTRRFLNGHIARNERSVIGQFFTPAPIASFMASLFQKPFRHVRILDPGAGIGTLFAALVQALVSQYPKPETIEVIAYETDETLKPHLDKSTDLCREACLQAGVHFSVTINFADFISSAIGISENRINCTHASTFTHAILNPPYQKISKNSNTKRILSSAGLEASNLYPAFVWLAIKMLKQGGEIVSITPRSFCNGPYYRPFRKALIDLISLQRIHLFESRKDTFKDDSVLQENVILYGIRGQSAPSEFMVSVSPGKDLSLMNLRKVPFASVIHPSDRDAFIHLIEDDRGQEAMEIMAGFCTSLNELGLDVSTGRVVEFRARDFLRDDPEAGTAPLLYPRHLLNGFTRWPLLGGKKSNAIIIAANTRDLLLPSGFYVLTKRFSAKEEHRRIIASVCDPSRFRSQWIGLENHLNYFHSQGRGMSANMAKGLMLFLNSTLVDRYFRLFSGHTQVNAADLRMMPYPNRRQLLQMGKHVRNRIPTQEIIDDILKKECIING